MIAWLVTNKYLISDSFLKLKELLKTSAIKHGITLIEYNNINIINVLSKKDYVKPDFVLFWDKDVKLAKYIESEGIKLFNSSNSIRLCDDKSITYLYLRNKGFDQPKTIFSPLIYYHDASEDKEFIDFAIEHLGLPFVFKECFGSFGKQVYMIHSKDGLIERIKATNVWPYIMQEFISESFGRDLRVYVVGDKVIGGMKRENKSGDFRANIEIGGVGTKYKITDIQKTVALNAVKELGLSFAGVDLLFGKNDEPILCEVNSNAYFVKFNEILNTNVEDYIFDYILNNI